MKKGIKIFLHLSLYHSLILLSACGSLKSVNDFFGIQMNSKEEKDFQIYSYSEVEGIKYQSNERMDPDINAWAEIGVEDIIFKIVNTSGRSIDLNYFSDQFIIITDVNHYIIDKGPRINYFYGSNITPGSSAEISFKIPSEFSQDFAKREGALLEKDIMGDLSKNWSQNTILKENIKFIVIKLSDVEIVLKRVPG